MHRSVLSRLKKKDVRMAKAKPAGMSNPGAQPAIESALRTLDAEGGGIDALATALRDGLGATFAAAVDADPRRARPRHRHRHGQVRPCRSQDRLDFRLDRNAGAVRASGRSEPWRPRHDREQRRDHGAVVVGRDGGVEKPHRLFAPLPHRPDRHDRQCRLDARQHRRRGAGCCRRRARPVRTISRRPPRR